MESRGKSSLNLKQSTQVRYKTSGSGKGGADQPSTLKSIENHIHNDPTAEEHIIIGHDFFKQCKFANAITSYNKALKIKEKDEDIEFNIEISKHLANQLILNAISKEDPNASDLCVKEIWQNALCLYKQKNSTEMIKWLDAGLIIKPGDFKLLYTKSTCLANLEKYEEAKTGYREALEFNPRYKDAFLKTAEKFERQEQLKKALTIYEGIKLANLDNDLSSLDQKIQELELLIVGSKNQILDSSTSDEVSQVVYSTQIKRDDDTLNDTSKNNTLSTPLTIETDNLTDRTDYDSPMGSTSKYQDSNEEVHSPEAHTEISSTPERAEDFIDIATKLFQQSIECAEKKDYVRFVSSFKKVMAISSRLSEASIEFSKAYLNEGNVAYNQKNYDDAIKLYTEAIRLDEKNWSAYYKTGPSLCHQQKFLEAIPYFSSSLKLKPDNHKIKYNFSLALWNLGNFLFAKKHFFLTSAVFFEKRPCIPLQPFVSGCAFFNSFCSA